MLGGGTGVKFDGGKAVASKEVAFKDEVLDVSLQVKKPLIGVAEEGFFSETNVC